MKNRIEMVANVVVILLGVVIGSFFLKDRFFTSGAQPSEVKAGDRLPRLNGWDWAAHDRTLVLVLRKGCHYCEDSAPFYQRLLARQRQDGSNTAAVAVLPDTPDAAKEVIQSNGLAVPALAGVPPERLGVSGTPALLLVDRKGDVLDAWIGMLSPRQELDVIQATACHGETCREPA